MENYIALLKYFQIFIFFFFFFVNHLPCCYSGTSILISCLSYCIRLLTGLHSCNLTYIPPLKTWIRSHYCSAKDCPVFSHLLQSESFTMACQQDTALALCTHPSSRPLMSAGRPGVLHAQLFVLILPLPEILSLWEPHGLLSSFLKSLPNSHVPDKAFLKF